MRLDHTSKAASKNAYESMSVSTKTSALAPGIGIANRDATKKASRRSLAQRTQQSDAGSILQFPVVISTRLHPIPSRTRKLSSSEPMVLHGKPCGRVGRCRDFFPDATQWQLGPPRSPASTEAGLLFFCHSARDPLRSGEHYTRPNRWAVR